MAEILVGSVLANLVRLLIGEPELPSDVYKGIKDIKNDLERIQSFLKDADSKADLSYSVRTWVKQVREAAFSIEDVIDEYMLIVGLGRHRQPLRLLSFLHKVFHPIKKLEIGYELANEMERIKELVRLITESSLSHELKISDQGPGDGADYAGFCQHDPCVTHSLFIKGEIEPFVLESSRDELTIWLKEEQSKRVVISVVGMGGIGKTAVVKNAYNTQIRNGGFDCYAWITVSQSYKLEELHKSMINQFYKAVHESELEEEIESTDLWRYLCKKKYLVVFDDVWNIDFWTSIKHALPDINNGSRVIITTRSRDVAMSCKESPFDHTQLLLNPPEDEAWLLFCKKAFQNDFGGVCPPQLEELSSLIVKRCQGLPLAIALIGGLLSTKEKSVSQWKIVYERLKLDSESDPFNSIFGILLLCYQDLHYNLKSCFLYFGIFPEDYSVNCNRLIKLWIAEGFVEVQQGKTLEEVAEEYLAELVHRNLVHVSQVNFDGKARSCLVHDLMRELIMSISQDLSFCQVLAEEKLIFVGRARRISIHKDLTTPLKSLINSVTRSIFLFKVDKLPDFFMAMLCADFKLLKVLDFQDAPLDKLPNEVGNLFHLRYLSIRGTKIKKLPKTIGMLYNLETLDIKSTTVEKLPTQINRLLKLRHILASNFGNGVKLQEGVGFLEALQKLYYVDANHKIGIIEELGQLRQLRKLGIMKLTSKDCNQLCSSIKKMNHLRSLHVDSTKNEIIDLNCFSTPPRFLQHVHLKGNLGHLPTWFAALQNLVRLHLVMSKLADDPLKVLQSLPNLLQLRLHQAYDGRKLYFEAGGFVKLKKLELTDLKELHVLKIYKGTLPILEELIIGPSPQLEEVPSGIEHLQSLTTLTCIDMPDCFVRSMLPDDDQGQDYRKVAHISSVLFKQKKEGTYRTYTLSDPNKLREYLKGWCY